MESSTNQKVSYILEEAGTSSRFKELDVNVIEKLARKKLEAKTRKEMAAEDHLPQELLGLKSFKRLMGQIKEETREKVSSIEAKVVRERNLEVTSPRETRIGNAFSSPFGLNDSFQKLVHTGPEITPTQVSKSVKDNTSKSFDEVPSFHNPTKSHKSDLPKTSQPENQPKSGNRSDLMNNGNLSFEDMGEKGANLLDDSFGMKQQDDEVHKLQLDDSFGRQDHVFIQENRGSFQILDPLIENSNVQRIKTNEPETNTLSRAIFADSNAKEVSQSSDAYKRDDFQDFISGSFNLVSNQQGSEFGQQQVFALAQPFAFANPGEFSTKNTDSGFQRPFGLGELSPDLRKSQPFGKVFEPRSMASITDEGKKAFTRLHSSRSLRIYLLFNQ